MRRIKFIFIGLFITMILGAQDSAVIDFSVTKHDFGKFKEEAGLQTYAFEFENTGNSDLLISRVTASCGCTSPVWTKHPVKPGDKGSVSVTYNPRNRPNKFKKSVVVYTNTKPQNSILYIEGDVVPRVLTIEELYRTDIGGMLRFKSNHLAFTDIKRGKKRIRVMEIINTSKQPVSLGFDRVPSHLSLIAKPETLKPGEKGIIEGTYDSKNKNDWGYINDLIRLVLNGEEVKNIYLVVSANLVEDFGSLSKEELANAAVFNIENTRFDFGEIKQQEKAEYAFKFTNSGKSDLIIRKVKASCGCTAVTPANTVIKPGESSEIMTVFNAGTRKGRQHKVITVITNDPKKSQISLIVSGIVLQSP